MGIRLTRFFFQKEVLAEGPHGEEEGEATIEVPKSFLDITRRFEDLAVALNAVTTFSEEAVAQDKVAFCDQFNKFKAITGTKSESFQDQQVRALAAYVPYGKQDNITGNVGGFLMSPDKDPVLMLLEEGGMQIFHVDTTQGQSWEYMLPHAMSATDLRSTGGRTGGKVTVPYPVDFWLYDSRVTLDFTSASFASAWPHPAVDNSTTQRPQISSVGFSRFRRPY